ncbi:hypothetical protein BaRGS_00039532, partial [Batillaria attramentaria]
MITVVRAVLQPKGSSSLSELRRAGKSRSTPTMLRQNCITRTGHVVIAAFVLMLQVFGAHS